MSKTTGKLKFDLALSTTSVYDASSIYVNKSAELSINGNANLNYKTIGPTYKDNGDLVPVNITERPGPEVSKGSSYIYIRNLGGSTAPSIRVDPATSMVLFLKLLSKKLVDPLLFVLSMEQQNKTKHNVKKKILFMYSKKRITLSLFVYIF